MKEKHTTGQKLKFYRERAELSQFELEKLADLSFGSLSKMEVGNINPSNKTLIKIADALNLNPHETAYLLGANTYSMNQQRKKLSVNDS